MSSEPEATEAPSLVNQEPISSQENVVKWLYPKELQNEIMSETKDHTPAVEADKQSSTSSLDSFDKEEVDVTQEISKQMTAGANYVGSMFSSAWNKTAEAAATGMTASTSLFNFSSASGEKKEETEGEEKEAKEGEAPAPPPKSASSYFSDAWNKVGDIAKSAAWTSEPDQEDGEKKEAAGSNSGGGLLGGIPDLNSITKMATDATTALKEKVGQSASMLTDFNKEQEEFIKNKAANQGHALSVAPWVGYQDEDAMKAKILSLSCDRRTFVRAPPSGVSFDFDYASVSTIAQALLKEDQNLAKMRYELVPKMVKEDDFWKNYFYRVNMIKQSFDLKDFEQTDEEEKPKPTESVESRLAPPDEDLNKDGADPEDEFISDSYQVSSQDMAEVDESMKRLGVSSNADSAGGGGGGGGDDDWEAELEGELNEFEVVSSKDGREDSPEWENQIQEMLDAEEASK